MKAEHTMSGAILRTRQRTYEMSVYELACLIETIRVLPRRVTIMKCEPQRADQKEASAFAYNIPLQKPVLKTS